MPEPPGLGDSSGEREPSWGLSLFGNFMYFPPLLTLDVQNFAAMEFMTPPTCV